MILIACTIALMKNIASVKVCIFFVNCLHHCTCENYYSNLRMFVFSLLVVKLVLRVNSFVYDSTDECSCLIFAEI